MKRKTKVELAKFLVQLSGISYGGGVLAAFMEGKEFAIIMFAPTALVLALVGFYLFEKEN